MIKCTAESQGVLKAGSSIFTPFRSKNYGTGLPRVNASQNGQSKDVPSSEKSENSSNLQLGTPSEHR